MVDYSTLLDIKYSLNDIQEYNFEEEMKSITGQFPAISAESNNRVETDVSCQVSSDIRRALVGRYPLCLKLRDDYKYWSDRHYERWGGFTPTYIDQSCMLNEPCFIAAAIAIRPFQSWEWHLVEKWSWVYRHACVLDCGIEQFEEWCEFRDPEISREYLMTQMGWLYRPPGETGPTTSETSHLADSDV